MLMIAAAISLVSNVILNLIFMELWGVVGIAVVDVGRVCIVTRLHDDIHVPETTGVDSLRVRRKWAVISICKQ